jgi:hypothetical protein
LKYSIAGAPYIKFLYSAVDDDVIAKLKPIIVRALAWRWRFGETKPSWSPDLPINFDDIDKLQNSISKGVRAVGDFAYSLMASQWDETHSEFSDWLARKQRRPDDAAMEGFAQLMWRIDEGIMHPGGGAEGVCKPLI